MGCGCSTNCCSKKKSRWPWVIAIAIAVVLILIAVSEAQSQTRTMGWHDDPRATWAGTDQLSAVLLAEEHGHNDHDCGAAEETGLAHVVSWLGKFHPTATYFPIALLVGDAFAEAL